MEDRGSEDEEDGDDMDEDRTTATEIFTESEVMPSRRDKNRAVRVSFRESLSLTLLTSLAASSVK